MLAAMASSNMTLGHRNIVVRAISSAFDGIIRFFRRSRNVSNLQDDNVTEEEHQRNLMTLQEKTERLKELMKEFNTTISSALFIGKLKNRAKLVRERNKKLPVAEAFPVPTEYQSYNKAGGKRRSTRKKRRTKKRRRTRRRR